MKNLTISEKQLDLLQIEELINKPRQKIVLAKSKINKIERSYRFLNHEISSKIIYGINTGFGPMASHILAQNQVVELQENLIRSHSAGAGRPIDPKFVLAAMIVRLKTLSAGYSGVSMDLINQLIKFINHRIIPVVPEHGAVGTSGDLVQMAHVGLGLMGEGRVFYQDRIVSAQSVLSKLKVKPYKFKPKEGLALINGTSCMTGIGSLLSRDSEYLIDLAIRSGALGTELVSGFDDGFSEKLNALRPHPGQVEVARKLREILRTSKLLRHRKEFQKKVQVNGDVLEIPETVQEVYSIRCIPQILGPVLDQVLETKKTIYTEVNSVSDNPIVDVGNQAFLHGGNFHGDYLAASFDKLKMSLVKMTMLSERRINFFLNRNVNKFLPPFINLKKPGLTLALQGLQFVATSTTANSQTLAYPHHIHSIPTNGDNQDVVSMGTDAALFTETVINNSFIVLAIELITLAQAVDYLGVSSRLSKPSQELYRLVRKIVKKIDDDRALSDDLQELVNQMKQRAI